MTQVIFFLFNTLSNCLLIYSPNGSSSLTSESIGKKNIKIKNRKQIENKINLMHLRGKIRRNVSGKNETGKE